jgi:hypothetical protein
MLQSLHADCVQVPNLQEERCVYGFAVAEVDSSNRGSADARTVCKYPSSRSVQRLLSEVFRQIPLARKPMRYMRFI